MVTKEVLEKYKKLVEIRYTPEQVYLAAKHDGYEMLDLLYITGSACKLKLDELDILRN